MEKTSAYDPPLDRFFDQFEADSGGYRYRRDETGPVYRVTADEKATLVALFRRRRRWLRWAALVIYVGFAVALFFAPSWFEPVDAVLGKNWWAFLPFPVILVVEYVERHIGLRVPLVVTRGRTPIAPALSLGDRRRLLLARLPDTVLIGTVAVTFLLLLFFALERPAIGALGWTVILASGTALTWAIVQGTRKWMLTRTDHAASSLT